MNFGTTHSRKVEQKHPLQIHDSLNAERKPRKVLNLNKLNNVSSQATLPPIGPQSVREDLLEKNVFIKIGPRY